MNGGWQVRTAKYVYGGSECNISAPIADVKASQCDLPLPAGWENIRVLVYAAAVFGVQISPHLGLRNMTTMHLMGLELDSGLIVAIGEIPLLDTLYIKQCNDPHGVITGLRSPTVAALLLNVFSACTLDVSALAFPSLRRLTVDYVSRAVTSTGVHVSQVSTFRILNIDSLVLSVFCIYVRDTDIAELSNDIWPIQADHVELGVALSAFDPLTTELDHVWDAESRARVIEQRDIAMRIVPPKIRMFLPRNVECIRSFYKRAVGVTVTGGRLVLHGLLPIFIGLARIDGAGYHYTPSDPVKVAHTTFFQTSADMVLNGGVLPTESIVIETPPTWIPPAIMRGPFTRHVVTKK